MNIIFISPECYPYTKYSFLGELVYSIAKGIEEEGHNVKIFLPRYGSIEPSTFHIERFPNEFKIDETTSAIAYKGILNDSLVSTFLIDNPNYFSNSKEIYFNTQRDEERFNFFCKASINLISLLQFPCDLIHFINPLTFLSYDYLNQIENVSEIKKAITIYNINYLSESLKEKSNQLLKEADLITTTSENYKQKILSGNLKLGIESAIKRVPYFEGLVHGLDDKEFNPELDTCISQNFSKGYFSIGKKKCGEELNLLSGFEDKPNTPTIGFIGMLDKSEGGDTFTSAINYLANLDLNIVVAGIGEVSIIQELKKASIRHKNIKFHNFIDPDLQKKIYAGCDFIIFPGNLEYSGISALIAMRYGAVPIAIESLASKEFLIDISSEEGNAIIYKENEKEDLINAVNNALEIYKNRQEWPKLVKRVMNFDSSNKKTSGKYLEFYENVFQEIAISNA